MDQVQDEWRAQAERILESTMAPKPHVYQTTARKAGTVDAEVQVDDTLFQPPEEAKGK